MNNYITILHLDAIKIKDSEIKTEDFGIIDCLESEKYFSIAEKSAEITKDIAIEFLEWYQKIMLVYDVKYIGKTSKELLNEFLKTKQ